MVPPLSQTQCRLSLGAVDKTKQKCRQKIRCSAHLPNNCSDVDEVKVKDKDKDKHKKYTKTNTKDLQPNSSSYQLQCSALILGLFLDN